jgi:hypothetical protein
MYAVHHLRQLNKTPRLTTTTIPLEFFHPPSLSAAKAVEVMNRRLCLSSSLYFCFSELLLANHCGCLILNSIDQRTAGTGEGHALKSTWILKRSKNPQCELKQ